MERLGESPPLRELESGRSQQLRPQEFEKYPDRKSPPQIREVRGVLTPFQHPESMKEHCRETVISELEVRW